LEARDHIQHSTGAPHSDRHRARRDRQDLPVAVGIVGDAKATLRELVVQLRARPRATRAAAAGRVAQRQRDRATEVANTQADEGKPIHPARLLRELSNAAPDDAIFVVDVGWNKSGAGRQILSRTPRSFITSGGLATTGFSPAAAIGAKMGAPDRMVIGLVGDGGLMSVVGAAPLGAGQ
jgi:acetolactate synthase I/II/III large subunit